MARRNELEKVIAELKSEMAWWDAELEAADVEDATEWERFPEMERVMYALAERMVEWESLVDDPEAAAETAEIDELMEFVEIAEENALAELAAFGFTAPGFKRHMWEFDPDEVVCFYEYDAIYDEDGHFLDYEGGCWPEGAHPWLYELL